MAAIADDDVELAPRGGSVHRQRLAAAVAFLGAVLTVVALTGGPWGRATLVGADGRLDVEMDPTGSLVLGEGDGDLRQAYRDDARAADREALRGAVPRTSSEVARVLAVIVALIALAGFLRDLTSSTWTLVAAASLACLVMVVTLRDRVLSALATEGLGLDLGVPETRPTVWGALAIAGTAAASLASAAAAGPRPVDRVGRLRRPSSRIVARPNA